MKERIQRVSDGRCYSPRFIRTMQAPTQRWRALWPAGPIASTASHLSIPNATGDACTIGIHGGYQGPGSKAVIPARAVAKLSFRLVPEQDPREIEQLFRGYVARITPPTVRTAIRTYFRAKPALVDRNHPAMRAAVMAYRHGFGAAPVFLRSGGTVPVVSLFQEMLGIPTVLMGFALPDDRMHAPNEKFHLPNLFKGIATGIRYLAELAERGGSIPDCQRRSMPQTTRTVVPQPGVRP